MNITATAPMRIDFAGGTIDLPPLFLWHYPAPTVNAAISILAKVTISPAKRLTIISKDQGVQASWPSWQEVEWQDKPMLELAARLVKSFEPQTVRIEIESQAPAGSGLGGSSVIAIALTSALAKLTNKKLSDIQLVEWAKSVETQTIKVPTGYQDYWAAVYGGISAYQIGLDGTLKKTPLGSPKFRKLIEERLMLVYAGKPHFSGINNWELFKQHVDGTEKVPEFFQQLKVNGLVMQEAFEAEDLEAVARVLNRDWETRKDMLPGMTTTEIEELTERAMSVGALALRVCGAGGGGCAALLVEPKYQKEIKNIVNDLSMQLLSCKLARQGVEVVVK